MGIIQDIWIVQAGVGRVLFTRSVNDDLDGQLFGGLMSAIHSIANMLDKKGLQSIELGDLKFTLLNKNEVLFIVSHEKKASMKKVTKRLHRIVDAFFDRYPREIIENWDGNLFQFSSMDQIIDEVTDPFITNMKYIMSGGP